MSDPVPPDGSAGPARHEVPALELSTRHLRGSSLLLLGRVASLGFTVATQVVMVRALTKSDFGGFAFALSITSASRFLLSLGQGRTLSRFLAVYVEERDYGKVFGSVLVAVGTVLAMGALLITSLFVFTAELVDPFVDDASAATVLLIVVFLAPLEALDQLFVALFAVFTKPRSIFFRKYLFTPGLRLVVVLTVALSGGSVEVLALGYVAAQVLGLVIYVTMLHGVFRDQGLLTDVRLRHLSWPVRNVFTFALPMLSTELVYLSMNTGSVLLLGHYFGQVEVADLRAVYPAAGLNKIVYSTFLTLYLPMASRLFARGDHASLRADYWRTAAFLAVVSYPIFAMTGPFASPTTVFLFGERYAGSAVILALLATGYYFNSALGFNMVTLQAYGKVRFLFGVNIGCAVLNLVLGFAVAPTYGAVGVAVSNCVTLVVQNVACQLGLRRTLGTALVDRGYARVYVSLVVATGLLWAIQEIAHPGLLICMVLTAITSVGLLAVNRPMLALASQFPELQRIPLLRSLVR
jgi:O-antigen/teichoic acid export membrane protein